MFISVCVAAFGLGPATGREEAVAHSSGVDEVLDYIAQVSVRGRPVAEGLHHHAAKLLA